MGWPEAESLVPKSVTAPVAVDIIKEGSPGRAAQDQLAEPLLGVGIMILELSGPVLGRWFCASQACVITGQSAWH
ncbi:MAG: hypothetical protein JO333_11675 [Verrucomicrobia bacterium]|nr:hypothetical protein [Verrucomicrobiota bacterium]